MYPGMNPQNIPANLIAKSVSDAANAAPAEGVSPRDFTDEEDYAKAKAAVESPSDKAPPLGELWGYVKAHTVGNAEDKEKASKAMENIQRIRAEERMHEYRKAHRDFHGAKNNLYK